MVKRNNFVFIMVFVLGVFFISLVLAAVLVDVGGTDFASVNESANTLYNFSVNNTQATENITEVNVTLPDGFVFVIDTNDTNSTATTFTNISLVLTWVNSSAVALVENLSINTFWFNATSSATAGDYNFTVTISNSTGVFEIQNLSVTVNDTVAPTVTINNPVATAYTTASVPLNVTLNENGTCLYSIDSGTTNTSMTTSDNLVFTKTLSLSDASYTVNYYCNDTTGNLNSSESVVFSVVASAVSRVGSGVSTYTPSSSKLEEGYEINLKRSYKVKFDVSGETHILKLESIRGDRVNISISSDPIILEMGEGDEEKVDVDVDGYYDLKVFLDEIRSGTVSFVLTSIREKVSVDVAPIVEDVVEDVEEVVEGVDEAGDVVSDEREDIVEDDGIDWNLWIALIVILVIVIVLARKGIRKKK